MSGLPRDRLLFLPLGGSGEIGMNLNLYGWGGKWLMVDCGTTFADESVPGVDLLTPDPAWINAHREDLVAIVLTHAHEDHLGAVPYLWEDLRRPVYATPFAAAVLRNKLADWSLEDEVPVKIFRPGDTLDLAPFRVTAIPLTHSIPEMQALAIATPAGVVLHTGDWKLDAEPLLGPQSDEAALSALGEAGVLALVCDSTNVFVNGESGSEGGVRQSLIELCRNRTGRIAITTFASNVARVETAAAVARATGREICLVGRSLWRMTDAAREAGYLRDLPPFLTDEDIGYLPPDRTLLVCTGCQGEPRGAMARIASGEHPTVKLSRGDTVVFSSRMIPGNERAIGAMQNRLAEAGVEVLGERDAHVHVSGHPARDELARMYALVRPRIAVPVHGEARHIHEHARFARSLQVPRALTPRNGGVLALGPGEPGPVGTVPVGRLAVDWGNGDLLLPQGPVLQARRRYMHNGSVLVSLALDASGHVLGAPRVTLAGVGAGEAVGEDLHDAVAEAVDRAIDNIDLQSRRDDEKLAEAVRRAVRREVKDRCGRRPPVEVHVLRAAPAGARRAKALQGHGK